ncbi:MAG: hypothetical protein ACK4FR_04280 [Tabrizicola sp.]
MHGVNLDLLRCTTHHPDGRPKDPHAHHRIALAERHHEARLRRWRALFGRVPALFRRRREVAYPALR